MTREDSAAIAPSTRERWLSKTVCVLARAYDIKAAWVTTGPAPSWWDEKNRTVTLNASEPPARDAVDEYAYAKGKLYHELAHVLHTQCPKGLDAVLRAASVDVSQESVGLLNVLEDGRIERKLARTLPGCQRYIRNVLRAFGAPHDDWSDLVQRVRHEAYTYRKGSRFAAVDALIREALTARDTRAVARIVGKILARIAPPAGAPSQPCYPSPAPVKAPSAGAPSEDAGEDSDAGASEDGASDDEDASDDANGAGAGEDPEAGEDDDASEDAGEDSADGSSHGAEDSDEDSKIGAADPSDEARRDREACRADASSELETMAGEDPEPEAQEFHDEHERANAETVARYIDALRFNATREHWTPSDTGRIDPSRIVGAVTGDAYRVELEASRGFEFACAILVDVSGSMDVKLDGTSYAGAGAESLTRNTWQDTITPYENGETRLAVALSAARILHGAMREAGIESRTILFGDNARVVAQVPVTAEDVNTAIARINRGTDGTRAVDKAAGGLAEATAYRRLILMVTDGDYRVRPDMLADLDSKGIRLVRVRIEDAGTAAYHDGSILRQDPRESASHEDHVVSTIDEVAGLPVLMESIILAFALQGAEA